MELAELLRLGAKTGRQIASLRSTADAMQIEVLAQRAEAIATALDDIVGGKTASDTIQGH